MYIFYKCIVLLKQIKVILKFQKHLYLEQKIVLIIRSLFKSYFYCLIYVETFRKSLSLPRCFTESFKIEYHI